MSENTPNLDLPLMMPTQAQKHVTHNEAIELLDALSQLTLKAVDQQTPPTSPSEGDRWGVGATPTGDWAGQPNMIATWRGGGWLFIQPDDGWLAWVLADDALCVVKNGSWQQLITLP